MDPTFVAFLDGNGVSQAEYLAYDGPTKATLIAAFQNSKGNIIPPHMYLIIPLLFNELTPWLLLYIYFLTASTTATAAPGM
jgi:hypothetical protein